MARQKGTDMAVTFEQKLNETRHNYASYANAEKKLRDVLGNDPWFEHGVQTLIAARRDGRFVPVAIVSPSTKVPVFALAHNGIFTVGSF
jgi:hypothetical protein